MLNFGIVLVVCCSECDGVSSDFFVVFSFWLRMFFSLWVLILFIVIRWKLLVIKVISCFWVNISGYFWKMVFFFGCLICWFSMCRLLFCIILSNLYRYINSWCWNFGLSCFLLIMFLIWWVIFFSICFGLLIIIVLKLVFKIMIIFVGC